MGDSGSSLLVLVYAKNQGSQVVKKTHLGFASSRFCPSPLRLGTIPPCLGRRGVWYRDGVQMEGHSILKPEKSVAEGRYLPDRRPNQQPVADLHRMLRCSYSVAN